MCLQVSNWTGDTNMDVAKVRPVIVGSGYIASQHVNALGELGIRPVAVWSPNGEHAAAAAALWGCPVAADLSQVLDSFDATHVHVCATPCNTKRSSSRLLPVS